MIYKIEGTGIQRKITAKIDKKFNRLALDKETFEVAWLQDKSKKKITVNFILNNNVPVITFITHSKQDIVIIETIISLAVEYAEMLLELKEKQEGTIK